MNSSQDILLILLLSILAQTQTIYCYFFLRSPQITTTAVVVTIIVAAPILAKLVDAQADSFKKILAEPKQEFFDIDKRQNLCYNFAKRGAK